MDASSKFSFHLNFGWKSESCYEAKVKFCPNWTAWFLSLLGQLKKIFHKYESMIYFQLKSEKGLGQYIQFLILSLFEST